MLVFVARTTVVILLICFQSVALRLSMARTGDLSAMPGRNLLKSYMTSIRSKRGMPVKEVKGVEGDTGSVSTVRAIAAPMSPKASERSIIDKNSEGVPRQPVRASRPILSGGSGAKKLRPQGQKRQQELANPNKLRILGGTAKGKKIESPDVYLRPMMAKVREALFSTLNSMGLFGSNTTRVLDTFCGSGSVGLEALSRGASECLFVDLSDNCASTAMRNLVSCGFEGRGAAVVARTEEVLLEPARYGLGLQPFQLVSITPPYEEVVYSELISAICASPLVAPDTIVVIEYPVEMGALPFVLGGEKLYGLRNRRYGRTVLGLYVFNPSKQYDMRPEEFAAA